jgi:hypothetical protein
MYFLYLGTVTLIIVYLINRILKLQFGKLGKSIPGPSPLLKLPFIGHGYFLRNDPVEALKEMHSKYGKLFRYVLRIK